MRETNRRKWARWGLISDFRTTGEFQNGIQGAKYSGLDASGMTTASRNVVREKRTAGATARRAPRMGKVESKVKGR
jgi:hypothetical protein